MSASQSSSMVGSPMWSTRVSFSTTRYGPPPRAGSTGPMPPPSRRMPISGCSTISTSAISQLVVASYEVVRPERRAVGQLDVDAGVVLREARHLAFVDDRHCQFADPAGQDALEVSLPQRESVVVAGGGGGEGSRGPRATPHPPPPPPPPPPHGE